MEQFVLNTRALVLSWTPFQTSMSCAVNRHSSLLFHQTIKDLPESKKYSEKILMKQLKWRMKLISFLMMPFGRKRELLKIHQQNINHLHLTSRCRKILSIHIQNGGISIGKTVKDHLGNNLPGGQQQQPCQS